MLPTLRYAPPDDLFLADARARIATWLRGRRRTGGPALWFRSIAVVTTGVGAWLTLLLAQPAFPLQILVWVVFGFSLFLHALVTAHDASHGAYAESSTVNRLLTRSFDLIGISSYVWQFNHVLSHHAAPNVGLYDAAIDSNPVLRLHPRSPAGRLHRWQHLYFPLAYGLATLQKWFFLDYFTLWRRSIGSLALPPTPRGELAWLLGTRAFVYGYSLVVPLTVLDQPAWMTLLGFLSFHAVCGWAVAIIFQVTHLADTCELVEPSPDGAVWRSWVGHLVATTSEFSRGSRVANFLCGGLNTHLTHHLFPNISHVHLVELSEIVYRTAREHGVPVREYPSVPAAVASHYRVLKALAV